MNWNNDPNLVLMTLDQYNELNRLADIGEHEAGTHSLAGLRKSVRKRNHNLKALHAEKMKEDRAEREAKRQEEKRVSRMLSQWQSLVGEMMFGHVTGTRNVIPVLVLEYSAKKGCFFVQDMASGARISAAPSHLFKSADIPNHLRIKLPPARSM